MNKTLLTISAAALTLVLIAAGTIYAIQAKTSPLTAPHASGAVSQASLAGVIPSADDIANGPRTVVPQGTTIELQLQTRLSTKTNNMGDPFDATVTSPVSVDGRVAIPVGAALSGHLILVREPGRSGGRGQMQLSYDELRFAGHSYTLGSRSDVFETGQGMTKEVSLVGGGAIPDEGAVPGAGASSLERGEQLVLPEGMELGACLDEALHVRRT